MPEVIEYYDPTFRPLLRRFTTGDFADYFDAYKVPNKGYPAPTLTGNKAAYWLPKPKDTSQVVPIIAVSVAPRKHDVDFSSDWMLGAAAIADIKQRALEIEALEESVNPIGAAVLEFALSGPYVVYEAFENVARLCPMPKGILRT
jgi:hypothetical protein